MRHYETEVVIVGSGPAGLAAADTLERAGWRTLILERGVFAQGVAGWPVYMKLFSTAEMVELPGVPFIITEEKPSRHQYLRYLQRYAVERRLNILTRHEAAALSGAAGEFTLEGRVTGSAGEPFSVTAQYVVLATGAYDHPNMLGAPGEELPKVSHYYREANDYIGRRTLIAGGRHSAAETALELARAGVEVTLCHRGEAFTNLKYWIAPDLQNRIAEGRIKAFLNARVVGIKPESVTIEQTPPGGAARRFEIGNDAVLALTGYHPDPEFLSRLGVRSNAATRQPVFDAETFESSTPGVYLAGVMLAGDISGAIFIENSRHHGKKIAAALEQRRARK